ncbi:MAG: hypothetical protein WBA35_13885, partial [Litorimonas sp.]
MSNRTIPLASAALCTLLLSACSTVPNNPNYEVSSKYGQPDTDGVQVASAPAPHAPGLDAAEAAPVTMTARHPNDIVSPTARDYDADGMVGTPGYEAMMAQSQAPAQAQPYNQPQYQPQQVQP